jgi:hypothetical protein
MLSLGLGLYPALFFMSISLSGPILENWLLSGKAVHKNISVGGAGLVQIAVPEGKTFIITKIEMLPFFNIITPDEFFANSNTFEQPVTQNLEVLLQRIQFQLLFYNLRVNSVYNVRNKLHINNLLDVEFNGYTAPGLSFEKQEFDCFHIIEDNSWLFLKYFDFVNSISEVTTDNYPISFDGSQNWPPSPQYGYSDQYDITGINPPAAPSGFNYLPQGLQTFNPPDATNQFIMNSIEVSIPGTNQRTAFLPPFVDQALTNLNSQSLPSIPFYNISVIEINRRLSTTGLL